MTATHTILLDEKSTVSRRNQRNFAPAFSMIEVMIVIIIIAGLSALSVMAVKGMWQQSAIDHTRIILAGAMAAATEYQAQTGLIIDHTAAISNTEGRIERFVEKVMNLDAAERILKSRGKDAFDEERLFDSWGRVVDYVAYVDHRDGYRSDDHLPERNNPYFASAGSDGKWGNEEYLSSDEQTEAKMDNIYSFDID